MQASEFLRWIPVVLFCGIYELLPQDAIESNNFQQLMVDDLQRRVIEHGTRLKIHQITSRTNKRSRIASLEPYIKQGNLRFCRKDGLLLSQLTQFPLAKNDDGPDALEMAMQVAEKEVYTLTVRQAC